MIGHIFITASCILLLQNQVHAESTPIRINCGSQNDIYIDGTKWEADRNWDSKRDRTFYANTNFDFNNELLRDWRTFWTPGFSYTFNVDYPGTYLINLFFSEISRKYVGGRLFDISINDEYVEQDFDIYNEAGGIKIQLIKTYEIIFDYNDNSNYTLQIYFHKGSEWYPTISAIEILYLPTDDAPSTTMTPVETTGQAVFDTTMLVTDTPATSLTPATTLPDIDTTQPSSTSNNNNNNNASYLTSLYLNCGSDSEYIDIDMNVWESDLPYVLSADWTIATMTNQAISGTFLDVIFQSERWIGGGSDLQYEIPAGVFQPAQYIIQLYFAETYIGNAAVGKRLFDIEIQGIRVKTDFDIFAEVGIFAALVLSYGPFTLTDSDDVTIELLNAGVENPKINGIVIVPSNYTDADDVELPPATVTGWSTLASLPYPIGELSAAAVDDTGYYIFGGQLTLGDSNPSVFKYIVSQDRWVQLGDAPSYALGDHQTQQVYNNTIYAFGGSNTDYSHYMRSYDTTTDDWSQLAALQLSGSNYGPLSPSSAIIGNKIYIAGGIANGDTVDTVFEYDILTDTWTQKASMPLGGRNHAAGIGYNGKFYLFGGRQGQNIPDYGFEESFVYDPNTDTWTQLTDMTEGTGGAGQAVNVDNNLIVLGGETCCEAVEYVQSFDPYANNGNGSWTFLSDMITGRHGISPVAINNAIYVAGGGTVSGFSQSEAHEVLYFSN